jgi:hypothetical protein
MPEELSELHEHAEHGSHDPGLAMVTVTMAVLAVLVAGISLLGHRAHTQEILLETQATDQWAYYQAKDIRRHSYELFLDELSVFALQSNDQVQKIKDKYSQEAARYASQQKDIENEARKAENDVSIQQRRADRFDLGEVLLEAALVISSITLLTRWRLFWLLGIVIGIFGLAVGAAGFFVR